MAEEYEDQELAEAMEQEEVREAPEDIEEPEQTEEPARDGPDAQIQNLNAALREEREKRKAESERAKRLEDTFQRVLEMQNKAAPKQTEPEEKPLPDPEADLGGFLYEKLARMEKEISKYQQSSQQEEVVRQQYQAEQRMLDEYKMQAARFAQTTPDFNQAYNALVSDRIAELETMGFPGAQAAQMAYNEEMMIVGQALNEGVNPAERIYSVAKRRGLVGKQQAAGSTNSEQVLKAASRANALNGARGESPRGQMSLEQLAEIDDPVEFEKQWNKLMRRR